MKLSLPAAVLIGLIVAGALVAMAIVYSSPRASPPAVAGRTEPSAAAPSPSPESPGPAAPGDGTAAGRPPIEVDAQVAALARACWSAQDAGGGGMKGTVDLVIGADGELLTHGVKEELPREALMAARDRRTPFAGGHGAVLGCLDGKLGALKVPLSAGRTHIEVPFTLP